MSRRCSVEWRTLKVLLVQTFSVAGAAFLLLDSSICNDEDEHEYLNSPKKGRKISAVSGRCEKAVTNALCDRERTANDGMIRRVCQIRIRKSSALPLKVMKFLRRPVFM